MFRAQAFAGFSAMHHVKEMFKSMLLLTENSRAFDSYSNYDYGILLVICFAASSYFSKKNIEFMATSGNKLLYANIAALF